MEVTLYSNHCPQCRYLESLLKEKNVSYSEVNDIEVMSQKGFMSMPMLEVNGQTMIFAKALQWAKALN